MPHTIVLLFGCWVIKTTIKTKLKQQCSLLITLSAHAHARTELCIHQHTPEGALLRADLSSLFLYLDEWTLKTATFLHRLCHNVQLASLRHLEAGLIFLTHCRSLRSPQTTFTLRHNAVKGSFTCVIYLCLCWCLIEIWFWLFRIKHLKSTHSL